MVGRRRPGVAVRAVEQLGQADRQSGGLRDDRLDVLHRARAWHERRDHPLDRNPGAPRPGVAGQRRRPGRSTCPTPMGRRARRAGRRRAARSSTASTRASRPKKSAASSSPNGRRPLYGLRASAAASAALRVGGAGDSGRGAGCVPACAAAAATDRARAPRTAGRATARTSAAPRHGGRSDTAPASGAPASARAADPRGSPRRGAAGPRWSCPASSSAAASSSIASRWRSWRRRMYGCANSSYAKSDSAGPRQSAWADAGGRAPRSRSPPRSVLRPCSTRASNSCASIDSGGASSW